MVLVILVLFASRSKKLVAGSAYESEYVALMDCIYLFIYYGQKLFSSFIRDQLPLSGLPFGSASLNITT